MDAMTSKKAYHRFSCKICLQYTFFTPRYDKQGLKGPNTLQGHVIIIVKVSIDKIRNISWKSELIPLSSLDAITYRTSS